MAPNGPAQVSPPRSSVNGSVAPALPKSRLAHDVVGILEDRIKDDPRGDTSAYIELIEEFKSRNKTEDVRRIYNQYLDVFPAAVGDHLLPTCGVNTDSDRLNNGVHSCGGRRNTIAVAKWRESFTVHCLKFWMFSCGLCTSATFADVTTCRLVM